MGLKIKTNKKLLGIAAVILAVAILSTPVLAAPGGQKVDASILTIGKEAVKYTGAHYTAGPNYVKGDVMQYTGTQVYFNVLTIDGVSYYIYSCNTLNAQLNPKAGIIVTHADATWYVTPQASQKQVTADGFTANVMYTVYDYTNPATMTMKVHATGHGFGIFEGQTIELSYTGAVAASNLWSGICIKG
jgi:hypothetical protein